MTQIKKIKNKYAHKLGVSILFIFGLCFLFLNSNGAYAETERWLSPELTEADPLNTSDRAIVLSYFDDDINQSVSIVQNIRMMMEVDKSNLALNLVGELFQSKAQTAEKWISVLPKAKYLAAPGRDKNISTRDCKLNLEDSRITCDDIKNLYIGTGSANQPSLLSTSQSQKNVISKPKLTNPARDAIHKNGADEILLRLTNEGLVTVDGGVIEFDVHMSQKKVLLDDGISPNNLSIFVRDPSIVSWNDGLGLLKAERAGKTEVFVVMPGRISIIQTSVHEDQRKNNVAVNNQATSHDFNVDTSLASLDGLDLAASKSRLAASHGSLSSNLSDLEISSEISKVGSANLIGNSQFVRAKIKPSFETIRLKLVDDRSIQGSVNFPVGGIRIRVAGTEVNELTNGQGEIEIKDVPIGSRLLLDISDDRGYLMPQVYELLTDRDGVSRGTLQKIPVRRYSSLDFIARSAGVVQNMNKSSLCGAVSNPIQSDVSVSLDTSAIGPFYFNSLGLVDMSLGSTGKIGRFCFFNIEPGPVTIGFSRINGKEKLAGVLGMVAGRHAEEEFSFADARRVTTTLTSIATANEQLGSDIKRASRREIVEQAEVYAVGSGEMMVPVDSGVVTSVSEVLPVKGRIVTVSTSNDFETTVQSLSAKAAISKSISTLVPNGFISDMSLYAQAEHNSNQGSVMVEHGNLQGHGSEGVKMRLVDSSGHDIGSGWYYSDNPISKAIFFNVPAGIYALIVETSTGHWLAADSVIVYSESVSVATTGGQIERLLDTSQHASLN